MSEFNYGAGRRTTIDDRITDDELRSRIAELRSFDRLSQRQSSELRDYELHLAERERAERPARLERIRAAAENPHAIERVQPTEVPPQAPAPKRGRERHAEARNVVARSRLLDDGAKDLVSRTVEADPTDLTANLVAATSSEHYARAFAKVLADPANGHRSFTTEELAAWQRADQMRSVTTTSGDALIPTHLDPSVMLDSAGVIDPVRQLARVVMLTAGGTWHGVSSAGVSAEWLAEEAQAADASPTFDAPEVETHKASVWIEGTIEALQDASSLQSELGALFADAKANHEAPAWLTGTGVGQPTGLVSSLTATETVNTAAVGAFADEDVYALIEAVPPRFRNRATWLAALGILNAIDQMETPNGAKLFPSLDSDRLLRRPVREASEMSENIATGQHILLAGDFAHYVIADRLGAAVEFVPVVMGPNQRPNGKRGFWYRWRVGGAPVVANAFRRLQVA